MRAVTIIFSAIYKEGEFFILNDGGDMMYWNTVDSESLLKDTRGFGKNNLENEQQLVLSIHYRIFSSIPKVDHQIVHH